MHTPKNIQSQLDGWKWTYFLTTLKISRVLLVLFAIFYAFLDFYIAVYCNLFILAGVQFSYQLLSKPADHTKSFDVLALVTNVTCAFCMIGFSIQAFHSGGIYSPILPWLSVIPLTAFLFGSRRTGYFWILTMTAFIMAMLALDLNGYHFALSYPEKYQSFFFVWMEIGFVAFIAMMSQIVSDAAHSRMKKIFSSNDLIRQQMKELDERNSIIETQKAELEVLSITDGLTKVYNRYYFSKNIEEFWSTAQRLKQPLSVMILDIDHFKRINDTYGHYAGDYILREFADVVSRFSRRNTDFIARYGGEEFVIVLIGPTQNEVLSIAENIRSEIEKHEFAYEYTQIRMTASIGVSSCIPAIGMTSNLLVNNADKALYQAKGAGRNCVKLSKE